eukprot:m51a1_g874 hypothetical protein (258) ;mRNA; r:864967-865858
MWKVVQSFEWGEHRPLSAWWVPLAAAALYVPTVVALSRWAKSSAHGQQPPTLRRVSLVYNTLMVALCFSTFAAVLVSFAHRLFTTGLFSLICDDGGAMRGLPALAAYTYYLTKYVEFMDTVFLALRRKNLTVLHVYHHAGIPLMTWLWLRSRNILLWWMTLENSAIHVLMYTYYLQCDQGVSVGWKKRLTSLQIAQLLTAFVLGPVWLALHYRYGCQGRTWEVYAGLLANTLLVALFLNFYFGAYLSSRPRKGAKSS